MSMRSRSIFLGLAQLVIPVAALLVGVFLGRWGRAASVLIMAVFIFVFIFVFTIRFPTLDVWYTPPSGDGTFAPAKKAENWAIALGWWIPRRHRADIIGDILEDCSEMRDKGCAEWRIRIQVIWQWVIAVWSLIPAAVVGSVWGRLNPPK